MVLSVAGKHAIITGGGSGINLAFARLLLNKGCSVLLADLQCRSEAQALLDKYPHSASGTTSGPSALFHKTDVTSWPQLTSLWSKASSAFPSIDIVVPGAGLFDPKWSNFWDAPSSATNPDSASRDDGNGEPGHYAVLDVNLTAPIRLSQLAIGHWTQRKEKGCLVHIGSMAGYSSAINTPLYFASKHGLHGFVRSLAGLRDELGIRVGLVAPGSVRTPMLLDDPTKSCLLDENTDFIEPHEIARAMYDLVVEEELGNGTIYQCTVGETKVIPEYNMPPPSGKGSMIPGYVEAQKGIYEGLRTNGMKV